MSIPFDYVGVGVYIVAALTGIALAGDSGIAAPPGMPDLTGYAMPAGLVLATYLLRGNGPVITIRHIVIEDSPSRTSKD